MVVSDSEQGSFRGFVTEQTSFLILFREKISVAILIIYVSKSFIFSLTESTGWCFDASNREVG